MLVAVIAFWHFYVEIRDTPKYLFPAPVDVLGRFQNDYSSLWGAFSATASEALLGYGLAIIVGFQSRSLFARAR